MLTLEQSLDLPGLLDAACKLLPRWAERHPTLRLDTTMVFTSFFDDVTGDLGGGDARYPDDLLPRLADLGERVLFGSDFPTIPYPYREQVEGVVALQHRHPGLGPEWLRRVLWHNGVELFGLSPA